MCPCDTSRTHTAASANPTSGLTPRLRYSGGGDSERPSGTTTGLNRRTHALLPLIEALERAVGARQDPRYAAFISARTDVIGTARARLVSHTERLQDLLAQCQLAPGQG